MNTIERNRFAVFLAALTLAGTVGCSMPKASDLKPSKLFSLDNAWPFGDDEEELEVEVPSRIVGMWTDTVLTKPGEKPQRGFGGRLLFYGQEPNKPVAVEGELVVYAFDESGREPTDNKPTRRYVFPADQMSLHQSKTPVGASYSFWLPWDEAGGPQTEVSLICRFQPKGGSLVTSEQTRHRLPGSLTAEAVAAASKGPKLPEGVPSRPAMPALPSHSVGLAGMNSAQLASYETPVPSIPPAAGANVAAAAASPGVTPPRQMTTTTIALPQNYQMPQGSAGVRTPAIAPVMQQQPIMQQQLVPQSTPATTNAPMNSSAVQSPNLQPQNSRAATSYQPQARPTLPTAYNPTFGGVVPTRAVNPQLQARLSNGVAPATTMHHLAAPPQAAGAQYSTPGTAPPHGMLTTTSQPPLQPIQQAAPLHTAGTATVSYR